MIVRYSETALDEIDQILSYVGRDNATASAQLSVAIEHAIGSVARQPESAPIVYGREVRAKLVGRYPYRIFYARHGGDLFIRNVRSTRRQLPWRG